VDFKTDFCDEYSRCGAGSPWNTSRNAGWRIRYDLFDKISGSLKLQAYLCDLSFTCPTRYKSDVTVLSSHLRNATTHNTDWKRSNSHHEDSVHDHAGRITTCHVGDLQMDRGGSIMDRSLSWRVPKEQCFPCIQRRLLNPADLRFQPVRALSQQTAVLP
jgi:hypothetical protein